MEGYLATITSASENWFVSNNIAGGSVAWLSGAGGGSHTTSWTWRDGPESRGIVPGFFTYTNWANGEPRDFIGEGYLRTNWTGIGLWGAAPHNLTSGYVIEYGSFPSPVPEPSTYLMLLAGLGLLGFAGRRS
ncbi:C-type lectin domain-containing protein [Nitrosomonas sp. Nm84]|uniref:C-type lectin domain-containing protein n=1 Tax=Nitrosomonas sp. Nm84 TaxID=200124 RepID=UPI000D757654|nr:C-type lectin domain-containing protein [Nitrosomonas sp. Nm84]